MIMRDGRQGHWNRIASARRLAACVGAILLGVASARCGAGNSGTGVTPSPVAPVTPPPISPPPPSPPQVFAGAGDIGECGSLGPAATARLLDGIGGTVFALGDNAYPSGRTQDYRDCYNPTWGRHAGRTRPTPGNHDYESAGAAPYFQYFGANAGPAGLGYYSFDLGEWHIISLNSNVPAQATSAQGEWLKSDLSLYRNYTCTLAFWHHPVFSSGEHGDGPEMRELFRLLHTAGADVVLAGHDHDYERFAPQDPDGRFDPVRGIRQFVVGTGGGELRPFSGVHANSEARIAMVFGVLRLTLQSNSYQYQFIPGSGAGSDSGSGACH